MDRLEAMEMLVEAVGSGSLSAAGRKLRVPLPTLSRKISDLEARLGCKLLVRSTRKLTLTDAGLAYLEACRRILDDVGAAERAAAGEYVAPRGALVVTAPLVFGRLHVLPVLMAFLAEFPEITVRFLLRDRNVHLTEDHVDLAVRIGALPDSSIVATRVGTVRWMVCASPAFLAVHGVPERPEALARLAYVTHDTVQVATAWEFADSQRGVKHVPIRSRLSVTTAEAAVDAAVAGVGLTRLISYQVSDAIGRGALRAVLAEFETAPVPVSVIHAAQGTLPIKMRRFLDFAVPRLRASMAAD